MCIRDRPEAAWPPLAVERDGRSYDGRDAYMPNLAFTSRYERGKRMWCGVVRRFFHMPKTPVDEVKNLEVVYPPLPWPLRKTMK